MASAQESASASAAPAPSVASASESAAAQSESAAAQSESASVLGASVSQGSFGSASGGAVETAAALDNAVVSGGETERAAGPARVRAREAAQTSDSGWDIYELARTGGLLAVAGMLAALSGRELRRRMSASSEPA